MSIATSGAILLDLSRRGDEKALRAQLVKERGASGWDHCAARDLDHQSICASFPACYVTEEPFSLRSMLGTPAPARRADPASRRRGT